MEKVTEKSYTEELILSLMRVLITRFCTVVAFNDGRLFIKLQLHCVLKLLDMLNVFCYNENLLKPQCFPLVADVV